MFTIIDIRNGGNYTQFLLCETEYMLPYNVVFNSSGEFIFKDTCIHERRGVECRHSVCRNYITILKRKFLARDVRVYPAESAVYNNIMDAYNALRTVE